MVDANAQHLRNRRISSVLCLISRVTDRNPIMSQLLFVAPCPLRTSKTPSTTCIRRPRTIARATNPDEPKDRQIGEPSWMNLAREISPTDSDDVSPRAPPKWEYPEGDPAEVDQSQNPWNRWNAAIDNQPPLEQRDVKAETDFWRSAAKDIAPEDHETTTPLSSNPISTPLDDILTDEPSKSEDVWRMARGVTGEMTEMQDKLRSELERYNPDENTHQYREIARQLVGPPEDPWENSDPIRTSQTDAEAGSGWNPDVDWMRFDDVRREQVKDAEKAQRTEAERVAKEQMHTPVDDTPQSFAGVDDQLSRTFTDQSVDDSFILDAEKLPGFLTSRMRRSATYGGAWSGAEEEARNLQEQGIPLRDPKADADRWRGVARDLNLEGEEGREGTTDTEVEQEPESGEVQSEAEGQVDDLVEEPELEQEPKSGEMQSEAEGQVDDLAEEPELEQGPKSDEVQSEVEGEVDDLAEELEETVLEVAETVESSRDTGDRSSWSSWRSSSANWEAANEKAEPRDPAKEVDMWRSSARDLMSNAPKSEEPTAQPEVNGTDKTPENEGSAWDQWRSANAQWESAISAASGDAGSANDTKWARTNRSDWGAGLGGKATSERSAWEQWKNVSGMGSGSTSWWNNRTDTAFEKNADKPDRSYNNADEWRDIAREALNLPEKQTDSELPSRDERIDSDCTLDSWRSIAKDLIEDQD